MLRITNASLILAGLVIYLLAFPPAESIFGFQRNEEFLKAQCPPCRVEKPKPCICPPQRTCPPQLECPAPLPPSSCPSAAEDSADINLDSDEDFPKYLWATTSYKPLKLLRASYVPAELAFTDAVSMPEIPPGYLTARECSVLFFLAQFSSGPIYEQGSFRGRATSCIARGNAESKMNRLFISSEVFPVVDDGMEVGKLGRSYFDKLDKEIKARRAAAKKRRKVAKKAKQEAAPAPKDAARPAGASEIAEPEIPVELKEPAVPAPDEGATVEAGIPASSRRRLRKRNPVAAKADDTTDDPSADTVDETVPDCSTYFPFYSQSFPSCPANITANYPYRYIANARDTSEALYVTADLPPEPLGMINFRQNIEPILRLPGGLLTDLRSNLALQNLTSEVFIIAGPRAPDLEYGFVVVNWKVTLARVKAELPYWTSLLRHHRATVFAFRSLVAEEWHGDDEEQGRDVKDKERKLESSLADLIRQSWRIQEEWAVESFWIVEASAKELVVDGKEGSKEKGGR